jgi:site-specific DNA recombinase
MARAILYAAKSTEDKHGSIPTQLKDCRSFAEHEGWEVADEFTDEAASAYSGNRGPGLAAARERAEQLAPSVLVVQHSDRLARGDGRTADHLADLYSWAVKAGVTIRTVQDDLFADERIGRVMAALMGMRNSEDSRRKSEAVAAGWKRRVAQGQHTGGRPPYGYRHNDGNGLVPVPHEAKVVRRIFSEFAAGRSVTAIARGLRADGIPTQRGGMWRQPTVSQILANPTYAGLVPYKGERLPGTHEPLVDQRTWERTVALLNARTTRRGRPPKGRHLFTGGMLRCGQCGEAMVPRTLDAGRELYYCAGRAQQGKEYCSVKPIDRGLLDGAVFDYFAQVGLDVAATQEQVDSARGRRLEEIRALRANAEQEAQLAAERLARVRRDYQDGKLAPDDWAEQREQLEGERDAAEAEPERLSASEREAETGNPLFGDAEEEVLRRLTEIRRAVAGEISDADGVDAVRAALARLFKGFVIHPPADALMAVARSGEALMVGPEGREQFALEPVLRDQVLAGFDGRGFPQLRREPLGQAGNNHLSSW